MIKVLVVEDSPVSLKLLVHILTSDPEIEVIGTATNGKEAIEFLKKGKPDVITMDIKMPVMDGMEATRRIMETTPIPIVIISASYKPDETKLAFQAIESGAVAILEKPSGVGSIQYDMLASKIKETVKLTSEVKVLKRWIKPVKTDFTNNPLTSESQKCFKDFKTHSSSDYSIIAIGASTGGPPVLKTIISLFPKDFKASIIIVQHISIGFLPGLIDWLSQSSNLPIKTAAHNDILQPGHVYFAPEDSHIGLETGTTITTSKSSPENGHRPSVSFLFRSVALAAGRNSIGVLLTGMGIDGARELKQMKDKGALTFAQNEESSVIFGMPGEAVKLDAAAYILPPEAIAKELLRLAYYEKKY